MQSRPRVAISLLLAVLYSLPAPAPAREGAVHNVEAIAVNMSIAPSPSTGVISGKVTRAGGSTAIAGATVKVYQSSTVVGTTTTNATGDYSAGGLATGTYSVQAAAAGYESATQSSVSVTNGSTTTLNISLAVPINYVYDDIGRLASVIDKDGNAATYSYDAVGNLLSISRQVPSTVSIIQFSPSGAAVGTPVTIYGSGYSATASQNSVTFNGTTATVTASSTNLIVTSVPTGATTGAIVVTSPTGSATSSTSFTVGSSSLAAPTITSFSPTVGAAGTSVSITGANFDSAANDRATVNISQATIASASSTSISTAVPSATASGHISVTTPMGKAVSTGDFFVPPSPFTSSDIEYTGRMSIGTTGTVTISTVNKIGLMLFDGTANQRISLGYSSSNPIGSGMMKIFSPTGTEILSTGLSTSDFVEPFRLPLTGTHTILVYSSGAGTGSIAIALYNVPADPRGSITIGGSSVSHTTTAPGQNGSLSFSGTANQKVSVSVASNTISIADVLIKDQWGAQLGSQAVSGSSGFLDTVTLPSDGPYIVVVDPRDDALGSMTLTLNNANDVTGTITPGGSSVGVTISVPGQSGVLTFSGTSGHRVSLSGSSNTFSECLIAIHNPGGSVLTSINGSLGSSPFLNPQNLSSTGTYSIIVDPHAELTGSITLTLYDVPADVSGSITVGGSAVSVTTTAPGQNGELTFSGTSGQQVTVHITDNTMGNVTVSLLRPDATTMTSSTSSGGSFNLATQTLDSTGTFKIRVDPPGTSTGTMNVTLTSP